MTLDEVLRQFEEFARDGYFLKAIAVGKTALKLSDNAPELCARIGELHEQLQLIPEAIAYFRQARVGFIRAGRREGAVAMEKRLEALGAPLELKPRGLA